MSSRAPLTRVVTLPKCFLRSKGGHDLHDTPMSTSLTLLQYPVAMAQPHTTLPMLHHQGSGHRAPPSLRSPSSDVEDSFTSSFSSSPPPPLSTSSDSEVLHPGFEHSHSLASRRWVREADELCVSSMRRSERLESINTYVATYKLNHPQWEPLLLPEVHVLDADPDDLTESKPEHWKAEKDGGLDGEGRKGNRFEGNTVMSSRRASDSTYKNSECAVPLCSFHTRAKEERDSSSERWGEVYINYNKMTSLELMSRHANFALKHLVQRGHAMYFITISQHSLLAPRGLVEASHVTCAYGVRGERLRTYLKHVGPLDARDILRVDPKTKRVEWEWNRKNVRRGVVAVSLVEGYGTWFQRKPMLWQRSRRIGALQAQMGAHQFLLSPPETVGRLRDYEVSLLDPHVRLFGRSPAPFPVYPTTTQELPGHLSSSRKEKESNTSGSGGSSMTTTNTETSNGGAGIGGGGGGAMAVGLIASSQVAQNPKLYMGQFEATVITALDAVHQLVYRSALHHHLVLPFDSSMNSMRSSSTSTSASSSSTSSAGVPPQVRDEGEAKANGEGNSNPPPPPPRHRCTRANILRSRLCMEQFLPISWTTRTPPPYVPLEGELPFSIQLSRPSVFHLSPFSYINNEKFNGSSSNEEVITSFSPSSSSTSTIGSPMLQGKSVFRHRQHRGAGEYGMRASGDAALPVTLMEFIIHQGVDHYVFDDSPSARPMKWWNQKSNMPYNGNIYCMRSSWLDVAEPALRLENPLRSTRMGRHQDNSDNRREGGSTASRRANAEKRKVEHNRDKGRGRRVGVGEIILPGECYLVGHRDCDWPIADEPSCPSSARKRQYPMYGEMEKSGCGREDASEEGSVVVGTSADNRDENERTGFTSLTKRKSLSSSLDVHHRNEGSTLLSSTSIPLTLMLPPNTIAAERMHRYRRAALCLERKKKKRCEKKGKSKKKGTTENKKPNE